MLTKQPEVGQTVAVVTEGFDEAGHHFKAGTLVQVVQIGTFDHGRRFTAKGPHPEMEGVEIKQILRLEDAVEYCAT